MHPFFKLQSAVRFLAAMILAFPVLAIQAADDPAKPPIALFNGRDFTGWEGDVERSFRVQDGAIVGGNLSARIPRNEFLSTTSEFGDFELRLQFKILGKGANAGVQIRSARIPNHHEMIGYQADLGDLWWGCLYDESRRNKVLARPEDKLVLSALKRDDWNAYRIRCEGPRIRIWLNEVLTVDYTEQDAKIPQRGLIGLQIHGGPPSEAWYRELVLEPL